MAVFNFIIAPGRSVESVSEKDPSFKRGNLTILIRWTHYLQIFANWENICKLDQRCGVEGDSGITISKAVDFKWFYDLIDWGKSQLIILWFPPSVIAGRHTWCIMGWPQFVTIPWRKEAILPSLWLLHTTNWFWPVLYWMSIWYEFCFWVNSFLFSKCNYEP